MARTKRISDEEFMQLLIDKQFEINGYTDVSYAILSENKEIEDNMPFGEKWYQRYKTTEDKENEFRSFLYEQFKKRYKYSKKALDTQVAMFLLGYGLSRSDFKWPGEEE